MSDLNQPFQPSQANYTAGATFREHATKIALAATDPNATIRVNGETVASGSERALDLAEGRNTIGVQVENGTATQTYTVEVTRDDSDSFAQEAYIKASAPDSSDGYATAIALSGNTLVAGAPFEDSNARGVNGNALDNSRQDSGAAYVFVRDTSGVWTQQAYLKASNADVSDAFGYSVAISGNIIAIGAPSEASSATGIGGDESSNAAPGAGAVYLFSRDAGGQWTQTGYVKPSNSLAQARFGTTVALDGNTLAVGAPPPAQPGTVYIFTRDANGAWSEQAAMNASDPRPDTSFGGAGLALRGNVLAVGAPYHESPIFGGSGAVYLFKRNGTAWSESVRLKGRDTGDLFGASVALGEDLLAVGAPGEASSATGIDGNQTNNTANGSGAAYVFVRDAAGVWKQDTYIKASNTDAGDFFGNVVALSGDWLAVTAENEASNAIGLNGDQLNNSKAGSGAAYLFVRDTHGDWSQSLYVKALISDVEDRFGRVAAALSETALAVGAPFEDSRASGVNGNASDNGASATGAVYIFQ